MAQTLEQLENDVWDSSEIKSTLIGTCHRLRKKLIDQFTIEDLRIMIGQNIGTEYLMPKALNVLDINPLADGDFFAGDLLYCVVTLPLEYWKKHLEHLNRTKKIVLSVLEVFSSRAEKNIYPSDKDLIEKANQFLAETSALHKIL
jgi:CDI immunity proteins